LSGKATASEIADVLKQVSKASAGMWDSTVILEQNYHCIPLTLPLSQHSNSSPLEHFSSFGF
jgi:hypothetical protein